MSTWSPGTPRRRGSRWWVAVLTFAVGIGVGVLLVGLLGSGTPSLGSQAPPSPSSGPGASASPSVVTSSTGGAGVSANAACIEALRDARNVYDVVNGIGTAISPPDFSQLDSIVRKLQPLQPQLQNHLRDCNITTGVGGPATASPSDG